jgi:hypothetical protein
LVRRFEEAGALSPDSARSLERIGLADDRTVHRLRERLVIRHAEGDRFYVDEEVWAALRKRRRRHASVAAIVALALILGLVLFTRTAHAAQSVDMKGARAGCKVQVRCCARASHAPAIALA